MRLFRTFRRPKPGVRVNARTDSRNTPLRATKVGIIATGFIGPAQSKTPTSTRLRPEFLAR
jgi:hypothetical protein